MTAELAASLQGALGLRHPPISVQLTDAVPEGVAPRGGSASPAGCTFWEEAGKGAFSTTAEDHALCAIGVHTHNLQGAPESQAGELERVLEVLGELDYVRSDDVAKIPVLDRQVKHAIYAPLADAPGAPDVVLLFVDARQSLVVSEAVEQLETERAPAMGRPACAVVPQVVNTGKPALSLGCCGARAYLDVLTDEVALWALPGARLADYAARITALAKANQTLEQFHALRRQDVAAGKLPTIDESLARLA